MRRRLDCFSLRFLSGEAAISGEIERSVAAVALDNALALMGCPDRRIDGRCSAAPKNVKMRRRIRKAAHGSSTAEILDRRSHHFRLSAMRQDGGSGTGLVPAVEVYGKRYQSDVSERRRA